MYNMEECGARIKQLRIEWNLKQEKFAGDMNISDTHLRRVESGKCGASIELLIDIADYFGVTLDYLIRGVTHPDDRTKRELCNVIHRLSEITRTM